VQIVALRVVAAGVAPKPQLARIGRAQGEKVTAGAAEAWIDGGWRRIKLYDRAALLAGLRFDGPAIVTQSDCTTCILPGFTARIDDYGSIHLETAS
jgi:N-methylhydantoinase A